MRDEVKARELTIGMEYEPAGRADEALARAKRGDLAAFDELMARYEGQVFRIALGVLGRREDAEDAVQEVFLRLHRFLSRFDEERAFVPWLYRVTVNVCHDLHGRQSKVVSLSLEELHSEGFEPKARQPDPEEELSATERQEIVAQALRRLPEKERAALVLRDIEGLSTEEVAAVLGSSANTVRSQISTARVKLKRFCGGLLRRDRS